MHLRTLLAIVAAALLIPMGHAAAQEPNTTASYSYETTFKLAIAPREQWVVPGATATYKVIAEGRAQADLHLAVRAPEGVVATLSADGIAIAPGEPGYALLNVTARDVAPYMPIYLLVVATSTTGEVQAAAATLHVREAGSDPAPCTDRWHGNMTPPACYQPMPQPRPEPQPEPRPEPRPQPRDPAQPPEPRPCDDPSGPSTCRDHDAHERRAAALERRVESLLARIERVLDQIESKPAPARMELELSLSAQNVTVGSEGGRVALLIENHGREGRVRLHVLHDGSNGGTVELEKESVYLRAHERTFVWIRIDPGASASMAYSVSAGHASVDGTASIA